MDLTFLIYLKKFIPGPAFLLFLQKTQWMINWRGLDLGADDYYKTFSFAWIELTINAIIRRRDFHGQTNITYNEIEIDPAAKLAVVNGKKLELTKKKYNLLLYFIVNKNRVLTKEAITGTAVYITWQLGT